MKKKAQPNDTFHTKTTYEFHRVRSYMKLDGTLVKISQADKGQPPGNLLVCAPRPMKSLVHPNGGATVCHIELFSPTGEMIASIAGFSVCSMSDRFSYETGKTLAHERAVFAVQQIARIMEGDNKL